MTKRIAINGFGRIGRVVLRLLEARRAAGLTDVEVVAINDLADAATLAHLAKYDSVHGKFDADVSLDGDTLSIDGRPVRLLAERDPTQLPWGELGVDVVLESTGVFRTRVAASKHLEAGAKKVLISAPAKDAVDATVCFGINTADFQDDMAVVSTASCTTNCLAPVAKVLQDSFGIKNAMMTTVHSYTNDQRILDLPHSDLRRARAAGVSMIPTTTGAAKALALVMPAMKGKFEGMAIRVPTAAVSLVDLVVNLESDATTEDVNAAFRAAAEGPLKGIFGYSEEPLVSCDYVGNNNSSVLDALSTKVMDKRTVKILAWYDNEWGFSNRAADLLDHLAKAC